MKPTLEDAILLAIEAHKDQKDKIGKEYILHPLWVMSHIDETLLYEKDDLRIIAVLHDVVEDTEITLEDIHDRGYSKKIVDAIDAITKRPGEERFAYLDRVMDNHLALMVKKIDTRHNTSPERMDKLSRSEQIRLAKKYDKDAEYFANKDRYSVEYFDDFEGAYTEIREYLFNNIESALAFARVKTNELDSNAQMMGDHFDVEDLRTGLIVAHGH